MKIKVNPAYKPIENEIEKFFYDFDKNGILLGTGERNIIKLFKSDDFTINVKSFKYPNIINHVVYKYFRKSKAKRSFENAVYLLSKNLGTPEPIAYAERFSTLGLKESYYASKHLEYDLTFRELITNSGYPERDLILSEFTKFTHKLHENNILFKDHSPGNTLIKKTDKGYGFYLVDLNRMAFKKLSFEERMKNFSRLTPKKEMIEKMSITYATLVNRDQKEVFEFMWKHTEDFQQAHFRKKKVKKKLFFWKNY